MTCSNAMNVAIRNTRSYPMSSRVQRRLRAEVAPRSALEAVVAASYGTSIGTEERKQDFARALRSP